MIVIQAKVYSDFFKKKLIGYYSEDEKSDLPIITEDIFYRYIKTFNSVDEAVKFLEKEYTPNNNSFIDMKGIRIIGNPKIVNVELTTKITKLFEYES